MSCLNPNYYLFIFLSILIPFFIIIPWYREMNYCQLALRFSHNGIDFRGRCKRKNIYFSQKNFFTNYKILNFSFVYFRRDFLKLLYFLGGMNQEALIFNVLFPSVIFICLVQTLDQNDHVHLIMNSWQLCVHALH